MFYTGVTVFRRTLLALLYVIPVVLFLSCDENKDNSSTGVPMIDLRFNGLVENKGMADLNIRVDSNAVFSEGLSDSCLDISGDAKVRMPVVISCAENIEPGDYREFTTEIWIKKTKGDNEHYVIAACKKESGNSYVGWEITTECNGNWALTFSDGRTSRRYKPAGNKNSIDDGKWHQIVFSYSGKRKEIKIYFDGKTGALFSLNGIDNTCRRPEFYLGADPLKKDFEMEAFNGYIDAFRVWARTLADDEISNLYYTRTGVNTKNKLKPEEKLTVMTWNIWHGGKHKGKYVGVQRVADIIRDNGADVVLLQETDGSGEMLADELNFYLFSRSDGLSVLSKYPFIHSYDIYDPEVFGCVKVNLGDGNEVLFCPVQLDNLPNITAYIKTGNAVPDSIVEREWATRGTQMRFILGELSSFSSNKNKSIIVAGDFNTGSHLDWTEKTKDRHYGLVIDFPVSKLMEAHGYIDTYRAIHQDERNWPGYTWSPYFKNTLPDRIDYIYSKGDLLSPVSSYVVAFYAKGFPSSHAAVVTEFFLKK
ncbi:MAG: exotoxin [Chlorobi bacterium]|nr:exotoxin [Chlorobiota bacterium]